jgi:adenylosuccinate synthase
MKNVDVLVDLQYGSCGKGKFAYDIAIRNEYAVVSSANMPNAGHTVVKPDGTELVYKALPSASCLATNLVAPTSVFSPSRLLSESTWTTQQIYIHEGARTLLGGDVEAEHAQGLARISSTLQGCTASMKRRIDRESLGRVSTNVAVFDSFPDHQNVHVCNTRDWCDLLYSGPVLHEVSQGTMLSVDWGYFPFTTSRNCTASSGLDAIGANHFDVRSCYGLFRSFPIRVGGPSGPMPGETTWHAIGNDAGIPTDIIEHIIEAERTTVTKKYRRVSRLSIEELVFANRLNGCTHLLMNFAQYIDWEAFGVTCWDELPKRVLDVIQEVEKALSVSVIAVGTSKTTTAWR